MLGIVVDQFRYDYLVRFQNDYTGGLARMLRQGAVFTNARYEHYPTVTAVGHAIFMSGAMPAVSGIVNNDWYDRSLGREVTSVSDEATLLIGGRPGVRGASPKRLLVSTVGDELKLATGRKAKVIGISLKDRAAILPAGHAADGAYWFDPDTGNFVSSTFYVTGLPPWVVDFNASHSVDQYLNAEWKPLRPAPGLPAVFRKLDGKAGPDFYRSLESTPYGNELVLHLAERAIAAEQLGKRNVPDLLTVSFSSNDYVGHAYGPYSPEVRDMALRVDEAIGKLIDAAEASLGPGNVLVVFTADHGVAPLPEMLAQYRMPGGRAAMGPVIENLSQDLARRFGPGKWVLDDSGGIYLNQDLVRQQKLDRSVVEQAAADYLSSVPYVERVYTRSAVLQGRVPSDAVSRKVANSFSAMRSPDVIIIGEPYWLGSARGTSHGTPYMYDSHVPVVLMGPNIKPGRYNETVTPNDIAPTLATMLDIETPSGAYGRVLAEAFVRQ